MIGNPKTTNELLTNIHNEIKDINKTLKQKTNENFTTIMALAMMGISLAQLYSSQNTIFSNNILVAIGVVVTVISMWILILINK